MRGLHTEHTLKVQLARELCAIFDGYRREVAAVVRDDYYGHVLPAEPHNDST